MKYPFPPGEDIPGRLIETMHGLDEPTRALLLYGNALEWLERSPADLACGIYREVLLKVLLQRSTFCLIRGFAAALFGSKARYTRQNAPLSIQQKCVIKG